MAAVVKQLTFEELQSINPCTYCASPNLSIDKDRNNKYFIFCNNCGVSGPHLEGRVSAGNGWNMLGN